MILKVIFSILFCTGIIFCSDSKKWAWYENGKEPGLVGSSTYPCSRFNFAKLIKGDTLYIFGGYGNTTDGEGYLSDLWEYDITNEIWSMLKNQSVNSVGEYTIGPFNPPSSILPSIWIDGDNLYKFGGEVSEDNILRDMWKYDINIGEWEIIVNISETNQGYDSSTNVSIPGARFGSLYFQKTVEPKFYLFGGYGYDSNLEEGYLGDVWDYNVVNDTWNFVRGSLVKNFKGNGSNPESRMNAASWVYLNEVYMFGGKTIDTTLNDIWKFKFTDFSWSLVVQGTTDGYKRVSDDFHVSNYPNGREGSFIYFNSDDYRWLYMYGGRDNLTFCNDLWVFDMVNLYWKTDDSSCSNSDPIGSVFREHHGINSPGSRYGGASWVKNNELYLFSGKGQNDLFYNHVFKYKIRYCDSVNSHDKDNVCNDGKGECSAMEECTCTVSNWKGEKCEENINPVCYFSSKGNQIKIGYSTSLNIQNPITCAQFLKAENLGELLGSATCDFDGSYITVYLAANSKICPDAVISFKPQSDLLNVVPLDVNSPSTIYAADYPKIKLSRDIGYCENETLIELEQNFDVRPLNYYWVVRTDEFINIIENYDKDFHIPVDHPEMNEGEFYYIKLTVSPWCEWQVGVGDISHEVICKSGVPVESFFRKIYNFMMENPQVVILIVCVVIAFCILCVFFMILVCMCYKLKRAQDNAGKSYNSLDPKEEENIQLEDIKNIKIDLPISEKIFDISIGDIQFLTVVKIYFPGVVLSKGMYNKRPIAVRTFNTTYVDDFEKFFKTLEKEVKLAKKQKHENLVDFVGVLKDYPRVGIVTEYFHRNLAQLIDNCTNIGWKKKVKIIWDISNGMRHLHNQDIPHRELSCENVLIDNENNCKIINHHLTVFLDEQNRERLITKYGNYYQAPEYTLNTEVTVKCDVFSFGMMMYELLVEKLNPFSNYDFSDLPMKIAKDPKLRPELPKDFKKTPEMEWYIEIMKKCMESQSYRRPHFDVIASQCEIEFNKL